METRFLYIQRYALAVTDTLLTSLCFCLGYFIIYRSMAGLRTESYLQDIVSCCVLWIISSLIFALYKESTLRNHKTFYLATCKSIFLHAFFFQSYLYFGDHPGPTYFIIAFYALMVSGFFLFRLAGIFLKSTIARNFHIQKVVAIIGKNKGGIHLANYLKNQSNLHFAGFLGKIPRNTSREDYKTALSAQLKIAAESDIEEVFISVDPAKINDLDELIAEGEKQCVRLKFVPDLSASNSKLQPGSMGDFTVLSARREPLEKISNRVKKRLADVLFSSFVILFLLSWLLPLIALIIKLQSSGPVFFKQLRSGRDNIPFYCYKFRSMKVNREGEQRQARKNDDRFTPFGKFIRKTSLDELPQFFNVLLGQMSVIGPRPHMLAHTEEYRKIIDTYMIRQFLKPGISGWAQVNGYRGETRATVLMKKRVEHDIWYMEQWSTRLDIRIILLTIVNIFKGEDQAY